MNKEDYGNLLKYLGILRYTIHQLRDKERDLDIKKETIQAIELILREMPILEQYIND